MANRHEIITIDFQVNAGKANLPLQSIQAEAKKLRDTIADLEKQLADGKAAKLAKEQLGKLEADLKEARSALKQFEAAGTGLIKGVNTLSQAIEKFNNGTLDKMSAAFQKAALNAATLAKTKLDPKTDTYKKDLADLNALIQRTSENLVKARLSTNELVSAIKNGGAVSKQSLEMEVQGMQELLALIPKGTKEYDKYAQSLTVVKNKLDEITQSERLRAERASGRSVLKKSQEGGFAQASERELTQVIAKLKEYQSIIYAPNSLGKKQYAETEAEIKKLQTQLSNTVAELNDLKTISKQTDAVLNNPKGKSFNELKAAIDEARAKLNTMRQTTKEEKIAYDNLAASIKQADFQMKQLGASSKGTATAFDKAWSRLKTYIGLYMGAAVAIQKIVGTLGDLMELSDKMGEVRKTTGFTAEEVGRLSHSLAKLDTRTPIQNLMELSAVAGQLGLKTEQDVRGFTEAANMLMVALPEMGKEGATSMLKVAIATGEIDKIRKQLQDGTVEGSDAVSVAMTKIGSTIDALRANSAAAAPAITDFVKRVGAVGAQSGLTIDQVAALGSTVDALGMRVEMSATALSRMLPAIRNNAFDLAKAIGVTPETIRNLYDTGRGMEAVLMILQHIKNSGMDNDSIENLLGKGGMAEVMKDLNQQGARAGIVFAGLSQNVDELRRQLDIAKEAYKENIAIQNEYNKMNDTTAAKWARLKNELEEMFVSDTSQRWLGNIIDGLRTIIHYISEDGWIVKGLKVLLAYATAIKIGFGQAFLSIGGGFAKLGTAILAAANTLGIFTRATAAARTEWVLLDKATKANIWGAVIAAIGMAIYKIYDFFQSTKEAAAEVGRFNQKLNEEQKAIENLFSAVSKTNIAYDERDRLIKEINSKYSKYIGYLISETTQATQLAEAHALVAQKIREEAYEKRILDQENEIRTEHDKDINAAYGYLIEQLRESATSGANATAMADAIKNIIDNGIERMGSKPYFSDATREFVGFDKETEKQLEEYLNQAKLKMPGGGKWLKGAIGGYAYHAKALSEDIATGTAATRADLRNVQGALRGSVSKALNSLISDLANFGKRTNAEGVPNSIARPGARMSGISLDNLGDNMPVFGFGAGAQTQATPMPLPSWKPNINKKNIEEVKQFVQAQDQLRGFLQANAQSISKQAKATAEAYLVSEEELKELRGLLPKDVVGSGGSGGTSAGSGGKNPWGTPQPAESSAYADMDAEALVARRKQMNKFVRALQTDTDVQSVLGEDAQLRKAIENGLSKDMRSVIEWYNTERTKIQDELRSRHLTNTGDWLDAKTGKKTKKMTEDNYALAELERYYQWRKGIIEDARIEEGLTETEFNRRAQELEKEHLKKRSDLRKRFTSSDEQYMRQFEQWWASVEELDEVNWSKINKEWDSATGLQRKQNDRRMQKDLADIKAITIKQLNAIADIIAKERPYDGITKNLQDNLTKMGILFADLDAANNGAISADKGKVYDDAKYVEENLRRVTFLLGEAEHAYSITIDDLLKKMSESGLGAWAEELKKNDAMQAALMAQLRTVFDSVQQAIKKEATLVKKEMDIVWNDVMDDSGKSLKQRFEGWISGIGQMEDSVKRANSLINAGYASENVANKLAIRQMQIRLQMQDTYYTMLRKMWDERIKALEDAGALEDAEHAKKSKNLNLSEEQKKIDEQRYAIAAKLEESQNNLYKNLREWAELLSGSLQSVFEASNAGNEKFYNERAKLELTGGKGGTEQIIVIDNAGTEDAVAHYETLDEMQMLEREREIEQQNAVADAWKKVMDDINQKMSDMITDQINAMLQNASTDANTKALGVNTEALRALTEAVLSGKYSAVGSLTPPSMSDIGIPMSGEPTSGNTQSNGGGGKTPSVEFEGLIWRGFGDGEGTSVPYALQDGESEGYQFHSPWENVEEGTEMFVNEYMRMQQASEDLQESLLSLQDSVVKSQRKNDKAMAASSQSAFAKMTVAANMYGIAYQAMSNDNMSAAQKFGMIAVQAAGNAAITALTVSMTQTTGQTAAETPGVLSKAYSQLGPIGGPIAFGLFMGLLGGLMGLATSKIAKSKSEIASVTGASNSVASGRLTTGMLTYAEGNVDEFTDPNSLTPGKQYNVDAADGRKYRARYTGSNPRTHITSGPEFHLVGERGREMIIDANTTRQITMNEKGIWAAIQTLSSGGRMRRGSMRRGKGILGFADGNVDDFSEEMAAGGMVAGFDMTGLTDAIDRQNTLQEALLERLSQPIKATFDVYGKGGLVDSYDSGKKTVNRYGQPY